ncbi:MAG TPA: acyl carrier protein [Motilibacteraceae bacterium]|nr:acyl carrier protein [Motilibacteraceae bacterium]
MAESSDLDLAGPHAADPQEAAPALPAGPGVSAAQVSRFIVDCLRSGLGSREVDPADVDATFDLLTDAGLDSLGFLELITRIEDAHDVELDLSAADVARVTQVGYLSDEVARASRRRGHG